MGTPVRMGAGYFPTLLGWILVAFGVFLLGRGVWQMARRAPREEKETLDFSRADGGGGASLPLGLRAIACIVASMLLFGFLLPRLGLVAALVAMFFAAALGGREFRWREVAVLTAVMTALAVVVFVYLLKLPFQLVPGIYLA